MTAACQHELSGEQVSALPFELLALSIAKSSDQQQSQERESHSQPKMAPQLAKTNTRTGQLKIFASLFSSLDPSLLPPVVYSRLRLHSTLRRLPPFILVQVSLQLGGRKVDFCHAHRTLR